MGSCTPWGGRSAHVRGGEAPAIGEKRDAAIAQWLAAEVAGRLEQGRGVMREAISASRASCVGAGRSAGWPPVAQLALTSRPNVINRMGRQYSWHAIAAS
jgi:hypothetical protein